MLIAKHTRGMRGAGKKQCIRTSAFDFTSEDLTETKKDYSKRITAYL